MQDVDGHDRLPARARQHAARSLPRARLRAHRLERRRDERLGQRRRRRARTATTSPARSTTRPTSRTTGRTRSTFTLGDHFFANVLGPSFPGHTFVLAAQAGWATGNPDTTSPHPYWGCDQALERHACRSSTTATLHDEGRRSRASRSRACPTCCRPASTGSSTGRTSTSCPRSGRCSTRSTRSATGPAGATSSTRRQFDSDIDSRHAARGLAGSSIRTSTTSTRSVGGVCAGENWTVGHINTLMQSDYWKDTAILFTMDDFGGWYDHVRAAAPVRLRRARTPTASASACRSSSSRPYAKPGFVFNEVAEQASIPRFIEKVFGARRCSRRRSGRAGRAGERSDERVRLQAGAAAAAGAADAHLPALSAAQGAAITRPQALWRKPSGSSGAGGSSIRRSMQP